MKERYEGKNKQRWLNLEIDDELEKLHYGNVW